MTYKPVYLDYAGFAAEVGLEQSTLRSYRRHGYLPPPDLTLGGRDAWEIKTVRLWQELRPGSGRRWQPEALAQLNKTAK